MIVGDNMGNYRESIGFDSNIAFGTEIEFDNVYLEELNDIFAKKNMNVSLVPEHKSKKLTYEEWYLDADCTVTYPMNGKMMGGELSSKVLHDTLADWLELKEICAILRANHAIANSKCSNHVYVNIEHIKRKKEFFEVFAKLIALYENDLKYFYMGDNFFERETRESYARSMRYLLVPKVNEINFVNDDYLYSLVQSPPALFGRRDGISIQNISNPRLLEIRYPNGTLNEKTIQNNINFSLKLVNAIANNKFDNEKLTKLIQKELKEGNYIFDFIDSEPKVLEFEELICTIATSNEDVRDFMGQYQKVLSTRR